MADDPAAPERRSRIERGADEAARRRTLWTRIAAGVAVLALLAVAAFLLLGDGGSILPDGDTDDGPAGFDLELGRVRAAPISERKPDQLEDEAREAADAVKATMDQLYFDAFVDEGAWGSYDDVFTLFLGPAADVARDDVDSLTLGTTAAEEYESLVEPAGVLHVVVLTNAEDVAISAVARVTFHADTALAGGGSTRITSKGAFFLRPGGDGWRIFAYRVDRDEKEAAAPTSSAEATP